MQPPGGGPDAQGRLVVGGVGDAAQGGQQAEGVEPVGESGQVDPGRDPDTGQQTVAVGQPLLMGVDIDDHQPGGTAGDSHTEARVGAPPLLDPRLVHSGGAESVTPAALGVTGTPHVGVPGSPAGRAVARGGLAARGKRMNRPTLFGTPSGGGQ